MLHLLYFIIEGNRKKSKSRFWASFILLFRVAIQNPLQPFPPRKPAEAFKRFLVLSPNGSRKSNIHKEQSNNRLFVCIRKGSCRTVFLRSSFFLFSAAHPAPAGGSVQPYSTPAEGRFCPLYLWLQCRPAFPGRTVCFAEKAYSGPEKAPKCGSDHLFCRFLPLLQCFLQKRLYKRILKTYYIIIGLTSLRKHFRTGSYGAAGSVLSALLLPYDRLLESADAAPAAP